MLPTDPLAEDPTPAIPFVEGQQLTARAIIVGLVIGTLACFSNSYFGLQTGWISMMSLPLSLLGFAVFKALSAHLSYPFSPVENVLVQTVAVAVGTLPVGAGLVGIIPALEKLLLPEEGGPLDLGYGRLVIWSMGVAFFGVFFAVPLRRQVIIREKYTAISLCSFRLRFPSGHATATMIGVLHDTSRSEERVVEVSWETKINSLLYSFAFSSAYVQLHLSSCLSLDDYLVFPTDSVLPPPIFPVSQGPLSLVIVHVTGVHWARNHYGTSNNAVDAPWGNTWLGHPSSSGEIL